MFAVGSTEIAVPIRELTRNHSQPTIRENIVEHRRTDPVAGTDAAWSGDTKMNFEPGKNVPDLSDCPTGWGIARRL